jgi:hypothetical protein
LNIVSLLLGVMTVTSIEMSITPMRGDTLAGRLVDITTQQVTVQTADGNRTFKSNELLLLKRADELTAPVPRSKDIAIVVTLIDGSVLHATKYTVDNTRAHVSLLGGTEVTISTRAIDHVRLRQQTPDTFAQWQELLKSPRKADAVVIRNTASTNGGSDESVVKVSLDAPEVV